MKKKILLFISLVLLAVQGWATPIDSLSSGNSITKLNGFTGGSSNLVKKTKGLVDLIDFSNQLKPISSSIETDGTNSFLWSSHMGEYMYFSFDRQQAEAFFGVDTVLYLTAHTGLITSPLTIKMIDDDNGVFDFQDELINPSQLTPMDTIEEIWHWGDSKWCGKSMKVGFHPSGPGNYSATFQIKNSSNIKLNVTLLITVVDGLDDHSVYISTKDLSFISTVGSTAYRNFKITAKNRLDTLKVEIIPYCEYAISYGENSCDLIDDDTHLWDRLLFDIEGSIKDDTYYGEGAAELALITPEEAAQGAIITVKYTPTWIGYHQAKILIRGEGLYKEIILHGNTKGNISVSPSVLRFPNYEYDPTNPLEGLYISSFTITGNGLTDDSVYVDLNDELFSILGYDSFSASEVEQQGATVWVRYTPAVSGIHTANLTIRGGGIIENKTVRLIGTSDYPEIVVDKESLTFTDAKVGEPVSKQFRVTGTDLIDELSMIVDESDGNQFSIDKRTISADEAKNGVDVTVTYTPTSAGTHTGRISITSCGAEKKTVALSGNAIDPPLISINKSSLLLDDVVVGDYKTDVFTVTGWNLTSNLDLSLTGATNVFSINKDVISPDQNGNASATITVTYRPISPGTQTAKVTISGVGASNKTVNLTGKAVIREITASPAYVSFSNATVGNSVPNSFMVTATNPNAPLNLKLNDNTGMFSFNNGKTSITITAEEAANGYEVPIFYKPTSTGSHVASITITGGGALEEKIVMLSGSAVKREITTTPSSWNFDNVPKNMARSRNIIVKADNLTGPLTVELTQRPALDFYSIDKTTITPAEAANGATIKLTYKPTAVGTHNATLTISGGGAADKRVSITGTCVVPVITTNKSALNFGTCVKGKSYTNYFTVTGTNLTSDLTLSSSNAYFTVIPKTISKEDAALGAKVTVVYNPTATGNHSGTINISGEGVNGSVNVSGKSVVPAITPSTTSLDFGNIPVGTTTTKTFTVKGTDLTGSLSLTLSETGTNGSFTVSPTSISASSAANGVTITVRCTATEAGSISGRIKISGGDAATMTVSLSAKGVEPSISTTTSSLSFSGSTISSKTFKVTGTNLTGDLSLTVTGTNSTNFSVSPSTISSSAAASGKTVTVTCNPKAATSAEAKVKISGGGASPKYVTLKYTKGGVVSISAVEPEGDDEDSNQECTNGGTLEFFENSTTDVNELAMSSKVYAEGQTIIIESPVEQSAIISDISGRAKTVNLQTGRNEIPVNASGIYIVRIREKTTKLMLK